LRLRILTFTSLFPNSIDREHGIFVYQRVTHLAARSGNLLEVIAPVPYFPKWLPTSRWKTARNLPTWERLDELIVHHPRYFLLPKVSMPLHGLLMYWGTLPLVRNLHAAARFDCIDAHYVYPDGFAAVLLGKALNLPVMVTARGTDINVYPSLRMIRPMIRWTLRNALICAAVSSALKEKMAQVGDVSIPIHVIPNGVDALRFQPVDPNEARRLLRIEHQGPVVVAVGSLIEQKGHQLLVRAIELISGRHPNVHLYILGHGPYLKTLERLIETLGLNGRVHLAGKRPNEELKLWFSMATMSCLASSREGWPNVVSESLACGTPVIATKAGGIPEILNRPELGILVERTPESIAAGLEEGLSRTWERNSISRHALARTWDTVAREIEELLATHIHSVSSETSREKPRT
jgi:teichuronic acid biosynthesis glycosyltransferase TuaC